MSSIFKVLGVLVWTTITSSLSWASQSASVAECSSGVCVLNVTSPELISPPCSGYSVLIAYSESSGATLIQCSNPQINASKILAYDRHDASARSYQIENGRFIRPEYLPQVTRGGLPDRFGSVPACNPKSVPISGELIVAQKEPGKSQREPYCYRIYNISASLMITRDDGRRLSPMTKGAAGKWSGLRRTLSSLILAGAETGQ